MRYLTLTFVCALTLAISLVLYLATNNWFGAGDWVSYAMFSALFVFIISGIFILIRNCLINRILSSSIGLFLGGAFGYGWTYCVWLVLGPWFGAYSFPVGVFWIIGGAVTGIATGFIPTRAEPVGVANSGSVPFRSAPPE